MISDESQIALCKLRLGFSHITSDEMRQTLLERLVLALSVNNEKELLELKNHLHYDPDYCIPAGEWPEYEKPDLELADNDWESERNQWVRYTVWSSDLFEFTIVTKYLVGDKEFDSIPEVLKFYQRQGVQKTQT